MTNKEFILSIVPYAQEGQSKYGVFASVTIAQACVESAYGQYQGAVVQVDHNLFGIKYAGNHDPSLNIVQGSKVGDGAGYYCRYKNIGDSCLDHGYFLKHNSRYTESGTFNAKNGKDQLKCIMNAGYAESEYYDTACSIIDNYNLYQYDSGSIVDDTAEKIENAVKWMENIANNDSHGYDQTYRWGEYGDYDCSSLVISGYEQAGIKLKTNGATFTGNLKEVALKLGFKEIPISNWNDTSQFKRGDIILNEVHHVCCYTGNGQIVQASINENGDVSGGQAGDQTGREIYVGDYYIYRYGWDCCLRLGNGSTGGGDIGGGDIVNDNNFKEMFDKYFNDIEELGQVYKLVKRYKSSILNVFNSVELENFKLLLFDSRVYMKFTFNRRKSEVGYNCFNKRLSFDNNSYIINNVEKNGLIKIKINSGNLYFNKINPLYIYQSEEQIIETKNRIKEIINNYLKESSGIDD